MAAAKKLFLTEGFEQTTIRKLAAAVGVSSAALYLYFPDKDAILRAIAESTFDTLLARLEDSQRRPGTDLDRFRAGLDAYVRFGLAHPDEYRLTFLAKIMSHSGPGRPANPCGDLPAADRSFSILSESIAALMHNGVFANAEPLLTAEAVWASLHGLTALLLDQAEHIESSPEALITTVLDLLIKGLSAPI
ncbi:MAG TPA: TetR/AcrR family transcriptional regulator [Rhodopila sp.]|nr:TetR/AcrR family transcriptional regulator [Rhodopila sp.]